MLQKNAVRANLAACPWHEAMVVPLHGWQKLHTRCCNSKDSACRPGVLERVLTVVPDNFWDSPNEDGHKHPQHRICPLQAAEYA